MISHEIKKKLTKDNLFGIIIIIKFNSKEIYIIMKASQHWKHRLKKKFGMGKQAKLAKKYKYVQIESTRRINERETQEQ